MRIGSYLLALLILSRPEPVTATAPSTCIGVPAEAADPAVKACESDDAYEYQIADAHYVYEKESYRERLRQALTDWLQSTPMGASPFQDAKIDLFLAVPEINPRAARLRVQVSTRSMAFVVYTSIHPSDWSFSNADVGILGEARYPAAYGFRAGDLLVKATAEASPERLASFLEAHGAFDPEPASGGWYLFRTRPFEEEAVSRSARKAPEGSELIAETRTNALVEWIATRERVFAFSMSAP